MKNIYILISSVLILSLLFSCNRNKYNYKESKGIALEESQSENKEVKAIDLSGKLLSRPSNIVKTNYDNHRLITVYKVNYDKDGKNPFIGHNRFYREYSYNYFEEYNAWHNHFMPGLEALYGYNLIKVNHINLLTSEKKSFFNKYVLFNTLYYPAVKNDTLNNQHIQRDYYLASVFDEDTNNDSIINHIDLRRFYKFDLDLNERVLLIPKNYSVMSSEYDYKNDLMYIFARIDKNNNGIRDENEEIHVFSIDLKNPEAGERVY